MGLQALEGKDVKDLLLNVGAGGGAAAAPVAGGAAAGGDAAAEEAKEEEKEEGTISPTLPPNSTKHTDISFRQRGVRRGYGLRSFRLECFSTVPVSSLKCMVTVSSRCNIWLVISNS